MRAVAIRLNQVFRHPEARANVGEVAAMKVRASKDERPGPSPFEGRFAAASG